MKIGSLFSGIGGLELGLERAIPGAHTVFQVEQDPYARAVLAKHWPNVKRYEDVRQVGAHNLPPVDMLLGGFPCQDVSLAGKRAGIEGQRSGLWSEYARIIGELRPRYVVVENVSALLAGGMGRVLRDLAACGYDAIWDCIPAAAVGAHHRRDRVFLVAYTNGLDPVEQPKLLGRSGHAIDTARNGKERDVAHPHSQQQQRNHNGRSRTGGGKAPPTRPIHSGHESVGGRAEARAVRAQEAACLFRRSLKHVEAWEPEPDVGRVADGVPRRVDRLRCLGNAVVPQVAEVVGRVVLQIAGGAP